MGYTENQNAKMPKQKERQSKVHFLNNKKKKIDYLIIITQAKSKGYSCFAIQFYGECWSGPACENTYAKHGSSSRCTLEAPFIGKRRANYVYMLTTGLKQ